MDINNKYGKFDNGANRVVSDLNIVEGLFDDFLDTN